MSAGPYRVVVVDDVPEIREIVMLMLDTGGAFRVVGSAGSGAAAVRSAERHRPDLVLLDSDMPGMSGAEAIPAIRQLVPGAAVVLLCASVPGGGLALESDVDRLADARIEKGVTGPQLTERLLEVMASKRPPGSAGPEADPPEVDRAAVGQEEAARRQLAALVESSDDAIMSTTLDGTIVSWNGGAEALYGYRASEVIGRHVSLLVPPERPDEMPRILSRIARGQRVQHYDTVRLAKDGARLQVSISIWPVTDAAGQVTNAASIARDMTDRRRADAAMARAVAQLERQNRELARSNAELDSFASIASHDLAQPLQVVAGYLELLQTQYDGVLDERGRRWVAAAVANMERMRVLVRDILHFARIGSAGGAAGAADLGQLCHEAVDALSAAIAERDAVVTIGALPTVSGDSTQLRQVFQNLIANAIKFVAPGVRPEVSVGAEATEDGWRLWVLDNGVGVEPGMREHVFEMFTRAPPTEAGGTGLGLAICWKLVARHGGTVWIENNPAGSGARFCFTLPRMESGA